MIDGTDVDMVINRKRAHKIILSEAFGSVGKISKFRKKLSQVPVPKKK